MSTESDSKAPLLNRSDFSRNPKTTWLSFIDKLGSHLWAYKDGKARWTLILDDAQRHASALHPSTTAAGLEKQALHQSILKKALIDAFGDIFPAIVAMHPNTDATDADGRIIPFGTNLLRALGGEIVPDDAEGITLATNDFQRALADFPGMTRGLKALKGWCDRITILYNDLVRLSRHDLDQHTCAQLDNLLILHDSRGAEDLKWSRLKDIVHAKAAYIAAPSVSLYVATMRRFGSDIANAQKLFAAPPGTKKHFNQIYSAAAICWCCQGTGHDAKDCKMLQTALADSDPAAAATQKRRRIYDSSSDDSDDSLPDLISDKQDAEAKASYESDLTVTFTSASPSESDPDSRPTDNMTTEMVMDALTQSRTMQSALAMNQITLTDIADAYVSAPLPLTLQETLFTYYTANFLNDNYPAWEVKSIDTYGLKLSVSDDHAFDHAPLARIEVNCGPDNEKYAVVCLLTTT